MSGQQENQEPEKRPNQPTIAAGNIEHSTGIAIGEGASATVNNYYFTPPKPPRPDYINMAPALKHYVPRPREYEALRDSLLAPDQDTVAISTTAALRGAGGYGKTTLAQRLCYDEAVQANFSGGILWVELGERPDNLVGKVNDLIYHLTGERPGLVDLNAAAAELAFKLGDRRCLLIIDDLWHQSHALPFLRGGPNTTRLITTRNAGTLPAQAREVPVEAMRQSEALNLLVRSLAGWEPYQNQLNTLAARLHEWPLLLKLANGALQKRAGRNGLDSALVYVETALTRRGLSAFDDKKPEQRGQAVTATLQVSLDELEPDQQQRFRELAVFPEDTDVPLTTVTTLWEATGGLDDFDTEELGDILFDHSLLLRYDGRTLRLHDVIRQYLLDQWGDDAQTLHQQLLDAYNQEADWANGPNDGYYFQQLVFHLKEAGQTADLRTLLLNFHWLQAKLNATSINDLLADYSLLPEREPTEASAEPAEAEPTEAPVAEPAEAELVEGALRLSSHVLARDKNQLAGQLRGRLLGFPQPEIKTLCQQAGQWDGGLWLSPLRPCQTPPGGPLIRTLSGHSDSVLGVAIHPGGRRVISASANGDLKVWNIETGIEERTIKAHSESVNAVAVTPDGARVISASHDQTLKVWNIETGALEQELTGHSDNIEAVAITPDGKTAVSASADKTLKVWNLETGLEEGTLQGHAEGIRAVAVTPDGQRAISASYDRTLKVWNLETGDEEQTLKGHTYGVYAVAVTPDGKTAVSASYDQTIIVWNLETGTAEQTLTGHSDWVLGLAITPDGRRAVSASYDRTLKVWNIETGAEEQTLAGHSFGVQAVATMPVGNLVVSASADGTLKVWDISRTLNTSPELQQFEGHTDSVYAVAITPDGQQAVSASSDKTLKLWDVPVSSGPNPDTDPEERTLEGHVQGVRGVAVTPDSQRVVSASSDWTLKLWDISNPKHPQELQDQMLRGHSNGVRAVAITPDGRRAVSASYDWTLKIWDISTPLNTGLETGAAERTLEGHSEIVTAVAITPDGKQVVSASFDRSLKIWDIETGSEQRALKGHTDGVRAVTITPDGRRAISAASDRTLKIWNLETGNEEQTLTGHSDYVGAAAITPNGKWVLSASGDRTLKVWNLATGEVEATYYLDQRPYCLASAPDGATIIVGNQAGRIFWFTLRIP